MRRGREAESTPEREAELKREKTVPLTPSAMSSSSPAAVESLLLKQSFAVRASSDFPLNRLLANNASSSAPSPGPQSGKGRVRVFLVRHGESVCNTDKSVLTRYPDYAIPLTENGSRQAQEAGKFLLNFFQSEAASSASSSLSATSPPSSKRMKRLWVSCYKRARDTGASLLSAFGDCSEYSFVDMQESIFLGEQQFGLFEGLTVEELQQKFPQEHAHFEKSIRYGGRFWARMPLGESRFDVASRVSRVIDQIVADCESSGLSDVIVVSHGITLRAFAMMWLGRTPEWFEEEPNPQNCSIRLLDGLSDKGYIFSGFRGDARTAKVDQKEEDLVAAIERAKTEAVPTTVTRESLQEKLLMLQGQCEEAREQLSMLAEKDAK